MDMQRLGGFQVYVETEFIGLGNGFGVEYIGRQDQANLSEFCGTPFWPTTTLHEKNPIVLHNLISVLESRFLHLDDTYQNSWYS